MSHTDLRSDWHAAHDAFVRFLDSVGARPDTRTVSLKLHAISAPNLERSLAELQKSVASDGHWGVVTMETPQHGSSYIAAPLSIQAPQELLINIPFLELHTWLTSWWLIYAWRARQLAVATRSLWDTNNVVAAAATARATVESAAAIVADSRKLAAAWTMAKAAGPPREQAGALDACSEMMRILSEVVFGAKFSRSPELKETFGQLDRANVLGQLDKLAREYGDTLLADYEWLCNAVHPSGGNTFLFADAWLRHDTETHTEVWFSGDSGGACLADGSEVNNPLRLVQPALLRSMATCLPLLRTTLDDALRMLDDVALTTRAPVLARKPYWRDVRVSNRNSPCPCRSGLTASKCIHAWGSPALRSHLQ